MFTDISCALSHLFRKTRRLGTISFCRSPAPGSGTFDLDQCNLAPLMVCSLSNSWNGSDAMIQSQVRNGRLNSKCTQVEFRNPRTGELKQVEFGWSWTLFLLSWFFGLPLFRRRCHACGFVILALWLVAFVGPSMAGGDAPAIALLTVCACLGLQVFLGIRGNEMTAKNYLELGWRFAEPNSEGADLARRRWGILLCQ